MSEVAFQIGFTQTPEDVPLLSAFLLSNTRDSFNEVCYKGFLIKLIAAEPVKNIPEFMEPEG